LGKIGRKWGVCRDPRKMVKNGQKWIAVRRLTLFPPNYIVFKIAPTPVCANFSFRKFFAHSPHILRMFLLKKNNHFIFFSASVNKNFFSQKKISVLTNKIFFFFKIHFLKPFTFCGDDPNIKFNFFDRKIIFYNWRIRTTQLLSKLIRSECNDWTALLK
jgi:hypothetical protein